MYHNVRMYVGWLHASDTFQIQKKFFSILLSDFYCHSYNAKTKQLLLLLLLQESLKKRNSFFPNCYFVELLLKCSSFDFFFSKTIGKIMFTGFPTVCPLLMLLPPTYLRWLIDIHGYPCITCKLCLLMVIFEKKHKIPLFICKKKKMKARKEYTRRNCRRIELIFML